ncbi:hypothetical protein RFI_07217 [Reticulomyxa filosa]|uniref:Uncharacterized protein n=1 Tax=Reticulomyxa filosa TaxID=46433 RepID=X6NUD1_RETFI|nr:hypothetical protein RFI_07217 [Reticulomyxa filosa]|eukprot:ETO29900.1 hypothetical protein RFI_07217 [Reticulomyxa filosa]
MSTNHFTVSTCVWDRFKYFANDTTLDNASNAVFVNYKKKKTYSPRSMHIYIFFFFFAEDEKIITVIVTMVAKKKKKTKLEGFVWIHNPTLSLQVSMGKLWSLKHVVHTLEDTYYKAPKHTVDAWEPPFIILANKSPATTKKKETRKKKKKKKPNQPN